MPLVPDDPRPIPQGRDRLFVVSALGLVQIFSWGSSFYLLAVISTPMQADTGWPMTLITGGISLALLVSGISAVVVGRLIEAHGGRRVMAGGMCLLATGLAAIGLTSSSAVYLGAWVVMGMGMAAGLYDAGFATLGRIFGAQARGPISALTLWGGFASTVCWPLSALLVDAIGWRGACLSYAAIHLCGTAPICLFALPRAAAPLPPPKEGAGLSTSALRDPRFWLFGTGMMISGGIASFWSTHLITILTAQGATLAAAVALGAVIGPAQVGARVLEMLGRGRHHPVWTTLAYATCGVLGFAGLWLGVPAMLAFIAYGAGNGLWSIARGSLPLVLFGPERYPRIVGMLALPLFTASALAPLTGGLLIDRFGTGWAIPTSLALACIAFVIAVVLATGHVRGRSDPVR